MKINFQGQQVEAKPVDFLTRKEEFNEYQLTDGKIIRMKAVVTKMFKLEGKLDVEGNPIYQVMSTNILVID